MINGKKVLAYIPARSGSKGIPHKNIKLIAGLPLISYSIKAAQQSQFVDRIIVSTDSEEYAKLCKQYGAEVPFLRPQELATDDADETDVIHHLLNWLELHDSEKFDIIIKLQPTSPLRTYKDIDNAIILFKGKVADSIISVSEANVNPLWMNTLPDDDHMMNFIKEKDAKNRQELKKYYQLNGAVYVSTPGLIIKNNGWIGDNSYAYKMPRERSVDIDEPLDLEFVEFLLKKKGD
ncbi:MAG: acylneuraminate cytidylyltransferase family protein [Lutibacter sp.]|nr:acylneuraminate cytidylyltransferase family protein [Lutibacter sp.]